MTQRNKEVWLKWHTPSRGELVDQSMIEMIYLGDRKDVRKVVRQSKEVSCEYPVSRFDSVDWILERGLWCLRLCLITPCFLADVLVSRVVTD